MNNEITRSSRTRWRCCGHTPASTCCWARRDDEQARERVEGLAARALGVSLAEAGPVVGEEGVLCDEVGRAVLGEELAGANDDPRAVVVIFSKQA